MTTASMSKPGRMARSALLRLIFAATAEVSCSPYKLPTQAVADIGQDLVLRHVAVVDPLSGRVDPDQTVAVRAGKIVTVDRGSGAQTIPAGPEVDATGKFVVPGYVNGHAHIFGGADYANIQALMLIHGITAVRQMNGAPELLQARREGRLFASTFAPKVLGMPGDVLMPGNAYTEASARAQVRAQKAAGADFIKVALVPPATFFAIGDEASKQGLPFVGHLPPGVDPYAAMKAGYHAIEHLGPMDTALIACSSDQATLQKQVAEHAMSKPPPLPGFVMERLMRKLVAAPVLAQIKRDEQFVGRLQHLVDTYDENKCRNLARAFASQGTWHTPTLIRVKTYLTSDDPQWMYAAALRYVNASDLALWHDLADDFTQVVSPAQKETLQKFWQLQLKFLKLLDEADVPMLAGTDEAGGNWLVPGVDLQQEFKLLADAGLTPHKILKMATYNGAKFFGLEGSMGQVAVGKDADLVLLDGNPLTDVDNLTRIHAVVRNGVLYTRQALDDRLQALARQD